MINLSPSNNIMIDKSTDTNWKLKDLNNLKMHKQKKSTGTKLSPKSTILNLFLSEIVNIKNKCLKLLIG